MRKLASTSTLLLLAACAQGPGPGVGRSSDAGAARDSATLGPADSGARPPGQDGGADDGGGGRDMPPACTASASALDAVVERFRAGVASSGTPGGAIAIVCGGEIVRSSGVGIVANGGAPVTPETRFQFASVTKSFTAAMMMTLVEDGTVSLGTAVTTYVPYTPAAAPYARAATVGELLSHSAGYPTDAGGREDSLAGWFRTAGAVRLWAPPGEVWNYSNPGYSLAGLAAQEAAGQPFASLMETRLFAPAGMTRATMDASRVAREPDYASGHADSAATELGPRDSYYGAGWYGPMGGAWGSVEDLARFGMLLSGAVPGVLSDASLAALMTPRIRTTYEGRSYGYGVFLDEGTTRRVSHSGSVGGFLTDYVVYPDDGVGVFAVVNGDWWFPDEIVNAAEAMLTDWTPTGAPEPELARSALVGSYRDQVKYGRVEVRSGAAGLEMVLRDMSSRVVPLTGVWPNTYSYLDPTDSFEAYATFWADASGAPKYIVADTFVATR